MELTTEEEKAIKSLHRIAKKWPESLWLFSGSGTLWVMKKDKNGNRILDDTGCVDSKAVVSSSIDIDNDGGDW